jgi:hypothetical protein
MLAKRLPLVLVFLLMAAPAGAKECRTPGAEGRARSAAPRPCASEALRQDSRQERLSAGRTPGFFDLGNGTEVRIQGRVRADAMFHR